MKKAKKICPTCGSRQVASNGYLKWICRDCGKQWGKFINPRSRPYSKLPCPWCGSHAQIKRGTLAKLCTNCGHEWRISFHYPMGEVEGVKEMEI